MINYIKSKRGAMGIGTLIIFIAMVLVAAVAASVLINTSGFLQQKASATGKESTEQVASGIGILEIQGEHDNTEIDKIAILITPNAGSAPIDLNQTVVMISKGDKRVIARYKSSGNRHATLNDGGSLFDNKTTSSPTKDIWNNLDPNAEEFGIIVLQDADGSCKDTTPVINKGDIVAIVLKTENLNITPRTVVTGSVQPEFGAPGIISFTTPATYLNDIKVIRLQ